MLFEWDARVRDGRVRDGVCVCAWNFIQNNMKPRETERSAHQICIKRILVETFQLFSAVKQLHSNLSQITKANNLLKYIANVFNEFKRFLNFQLIRNTKKNRLIEKKNVMCYFNHWITWKFITIQKRNIFMYILI